MTRDQLLERIHYLESCQRFYDHADTAQWFNEREQRESNLRQLEAARKVLAEMETGNGT